MLIRRWGKQKKTFTVGLAAVGLLGTAEVGLEKRQQLSGVESLWRARDKEPGMRPLPPAFQLGDKLVIKVTKGNTGRGGGGS